ncbi:MAG: tetratricopeptide repeat protein, partial [Bacteroidota bacterium]
MLGRRFILFGLFVLVLQVDAIPLEREIRKADYLELRQMIGRREFSEALSRCEDLVEKYPDHLPFYESLAEVAQYGGELDHAIKFFEKRIEDGTEMPLSYFGLGNTYYLMNDDRRAVRLFMRAIDLGLAAPECYKAFEYAYERLEGVETTIRVFTSLCHRYPDNANYWYASALAYWSKADFNQALQYLDEAVMRDPDEPRFHQARAALLFRLRRQEEATSIALQHIALAEAYGDITGAELIRSHQIQKLVEERLYEKAKELCSQSIQRREYYGLFRWAGWGYLQYAGIAFLQSEYVTSLEQTREALDLAALADDRELLEFSLARQYESSMEKGDFVLATSSARARFEITKNQGSQSTILALNDLGRAFQARGVYQTGLNYSIEALARAQIERVDSSLLCQIHTNLG